MPQHYSADSLGQGADRPVNARAVVERGCGIIPGKSGLTSAA